MTDDPTQSGPPKPDDSGGEEMVEDLEAPAEAQDHVAGGRDDETCRCAGSTLV